MSQSKAQTFEEVINKRGSIVYRTSGVSMLPMLKENRDLVFIVKPTGRLKKYDVPLYKRGDKYILHRIIKVRENDYVIRGDNTYQKEYGICDSDIVGILNTFVRNGKEYSVNDIKYRIYSRIWCALYPIRYARRFWRPTLGKLKARLLKSIRGK